MPWVYTKAKIKINQLPLIMKNFAYYIFLSLIIISCNTVKDEDKTKKNKIKQIQQMKTQQL